MYSTNKFERAYEILQEAVGDWGNLETLGEEMFEAVYTLDRELGRTFEQVQHLNHSLQAATREHDAGMERGISYLCPIHFAQDAAELDAQLTKLQALREQVVSWGPILKASLR